jgi:hypothetical protein
MLQLRVDPTAPGGNYGREGKFMFSVGLLAGLFIGLFLGVVLMSLLTVSDASPDEPQEAEKEIVRARLA